MSGSSEKMTRRRFLGGLALAAGTTAVAACAPPGTGGGADNGAQGGGAPAAGTEGAAGGPAAKEAKEITFLNWDEVKDTPLEAAIEDFQKQSGKKVTVQPTPAQDYDTKLRTLLASGAPPDVVRINDDNLRAYSVADYLLDLGPYIQKSGIDRGKYFEPAYDFAEQPDGKHTAWILGSHPLVMFYNVDMFEEARAPKPPSKWTAENWRWDDFLDIAKKLTKPGKRWGALVYDQWPALQTFSVNNGLKEGVYSEDGRKFALAKPKGAGAAQWLADLTCQHGAQPEWSSLQGGVDGNQLFASGKVGMLFRPSSAVMPYLRESIKDFTWDVAPTPGNADQKTVVATVVFSIPRTAKNPDAGWELLSFLGGPEGGKVFAKAQYFVPIYKGAADELRATEGQPPANINLLIQALDHGTVENVTENTVRARQIFQPQFDLIYTCEEAAQVVLNKVKPEVEDALAREF